MNQKKEAVIIIPFRSLKKKFNFKFWRFFIYKPILFCMFIFTLFLNLINAQAWSQQQEEGAIDTMGTLTQPLTAAASVAMQGEVTQVTRSDGTPLVFARGTDNLMYYSECKANAVSWYPFWTKICGTAPTKGNIVAVAKSNGEVWIFSKSSTSDKVVYSKYTTGGAFSNWATLGGTTGLITTATSEIAAGLNTNGTIEVFAKKVNDITLFKLKQNTNGTWPSSWPTSPMATGSIGDKITVGVNNYYEPGRLQVFAKNSSTQLVTLYQTTPGCCWTTSYSNLYGYVSRNISVVSNHENKLEVYNIDNISLNRRVQTSKTTWSSWETLPLPPLSSTITVIKPSYDGALQAFFVGSTGLATRAWQTTPGSWAGAGTGTFGAPNPDLTMPQNANIPSISVNYHTGLQRWMVFAYGSSRYGSDLHFSYWDFNAWTQWAVALRPFDQDGNMYSVVKLGNQIWMVENLKTTKLMNSGTSIQLVTDNTEWAALQSMAYCWYNNDIAYKDSYGALYNWHTISTGELGIEGWHVPTDTEWTTLANWLIANGYNWDGTTTGNKIAKSMAAQQDWKLVSQVRPGIPGFQLNLNNRSGFSALPSGCRSFLDGNFESAGYYSLWWTAVESDPFKAYFYGFFSDQVDLYKNYHEGDGMRCGFSVRLVRN